MDLPEAARLHAARCDRLSEVDPATLESVQDWVARCEKLWNRQLDAIKRRAEETGQGTESTPNGDIKPLTQEMEP